MKIYIFKAKSLIRFSIGLIISACALIGILQSYPDAIGVFSPEKELPIYSVESNEKKVAITFDCAWGADDIPNILSSLRASGVKATFFLVGQWVDKFPHTVKAISSDGHDVGNHSYSHLRMGVLDETKIRQEISVCAKRLSDITGKKVDLFRAPYGDYNNRVIKTARELGYYTIQWDVDSLDWKPQIGKEEIISRVIRKIKPGSIILFHNDTRFTAQILPEIIKSIQGKGFSLVPVSELIIRKGYTIDFEGRQKSIN